MQLCTFTKLLFFQNNISRKLLFILARMINSLGLCLKNVSKLIDAFVTSSIYFDVQKFPYLFENIYISNQMDSFELSTYTVYFRNKINSKLQIYIFFGLSILLEKLSYLWRICKQLEHKDKELFEIEICSNCRVDNRGKKDSQWQYYLLWKGNSVRKWKSDYELTNNSKQW